MANSVIEKEIKINITKSSLKNLADLKDLISYIDTVSKSSTFLKGLKEINKTLELTAKKAKKTKKALEDTVDDKSKKTKTNKYSVVMKEAKSAFKGGGKVLDTFNKMTMDIFGLSFSIKDNFMQILKSAGTVLSKTSGAATYGIGSSLVTNAAARQQQLKYGLSDSQNYAFSQAKSLLNIQSDEDLLYMNASQKQLFSQYMSKFSAWYDNLAQSGVLRNVQELQLESEMFKQEMSYELLSWIGQNKDLIIGAMKGILSIFEYVGQIANKLLGTSLASDTGGSVNNSSIKTVTLNVSNTTTGVISNQNGLVESYQSMLNDSLKTLSAELGD